MASAVKQIDGIISQLDTPKTNDNVKTIGTHSGTFHCDEVLACYMLSNHTKEFRNANIIRSRDPEVLKQADIVVDVGAVYDDKAQQFDHHQSTFMETFSSKFDTKLSSAGLIYKHFGKEIIADIIQSHDSDQKSDDLSSETISILHDKIYESFMEGVDGIDNGITQYDTDKPKLYQISTDLSSRVGHLNPWWNQENNDEIAMRQFKKAMDYAGKELVDAVIYKYRCWLPARSIVENALANRYTIHKSGRILQLEHCPWKQHFFDIHKEKTIEPMPYYVLFQDTKGGWRISATPKAPGSFDLVKALPKPWRGIRDGELDKICGVEGCVFVHSSGFIGGNKTYEGAMAMAIKAVEFVE